MTSEASALVVSRTTTGSACVLAVEGVLDTTTYLQLRDTIIKAALEEPSAVIVDVDALGVPSISAWSVFTSARWHVSVWPDVPIILVCTPARGRDVGAAVSRYVPVHATVDSALNAIEADDRRFRRRARADLPASLASLRQSRALINEWLTAWSQPMLIPVATVIVNVFVENVLRHTASAPVVTIESIGTTVTIAVRDGSLTPAVRHEDPSRGGNPASGLAIVASLSRSWGSMPTPSGKTVWALVGPENQL